MTERFGHKPYVNDCLQELEHFFLKGRELAASGVENPFSMAFTMQTKRRYLSYGEFDPRLEGVPAVCLRVPTGGGKTALGARVIKVVRDAFLTTETPWVMWLVPSTTIRDQTLRQMRDRSSPLRQLLDEEFNSRILPVDVRGALEISRGDASGNVVILVSTLATSRIEKTENRRFYRENGALMAHFENLQSDALSLLEPGEDGQVVPSLENLLRLHRPLVIVDEAHNAKSPLSFEMMGRVAPSAIVELTATPANERGASNVLHYVHASELKAAHMIKMPLLAREENDWKKCLAEAKAQREHLEVLARREEEATGEFLRPVALIGAEKKNENYTVDRVLEVLTDELRIPRAHIAVSTGAVDEIGEQSIGSFGCEIRYVVTVDKLREGWDCPSAYVLASVREMRSGTAVEQMVGRVLRLPRASPKNTPELNQSYAFLRSNTTLGAISSLKDALVANGFSRPETEAWVEQVSLPLGMPDAKIAVSERQPKLDFQIDQRRAPNWAVPLLSLDLGGDSIPLEPEFFLPGDWDINAYDPRLSNDELGLRADSGSFSFDVAAKDLKVGWVSFEVAQLERQLTLLNAEDNWTTPADLALWLDQTIAHRDVPHGAMRVWLMNLCSDLTKRIPLREIEINRMRVRRAVAAKINAARVCEKRKVQEQLFDTRQVDGWGKAAWEESLAWKVPSLYAPPELYSGHFRYRKHVIEGTIGKMNGEEAECAWALDSSNHVEAWFRNVERQPGAFWLPTASDKFYPDFLALLKTGQTAVIEFKGVDRINSPDSEEKASMGQLWAKLSDGQGCFLMVDKNDYATRIHQLM